MSKKVTFIKCAVAAATLLSMQQASALSVSAYTGGAPTTATSYAAPSVANAAALTLPVVGVQTTVATTSVTINNPGFLEVYLRLPTGGTWNRAQMTGVTPTTGVSGFVAQAIAAGDFSTDNSTLRLRFQAQGGAGFVTVGLGAAFTLPSTLAGVTGNGGLTAAGTALAIQGSLFGTSTASATVPGATTALPTNIEAPATGTVGNSVLPATCTVAAQANGNNGGASAAQIDVINSGTNNGKVLINLTGITPPRTVNFGSATCNVVTPAPVDNTLAAYVFTNHRIETTLAGNFNAADTAVNGGVYASTTVDCNTPSAGTLDTPRTTATVNFNVGALPQQVFYCYSTLTPATNSPVISETTPAITSRVRQCQTGGVPAACAGATTFVDASAAANGNLFALLRNGSLIDVRYYIPNATIGGTSNVVRIVNTGTLNIAANSMRFQWIGADGTTGASCSYAAALPAQGAVNLQASDIETTCPLPGTVVAATANTWPRLRVTAPANDMTIQYYVLIGGTFVNLSAGQESQSPSATATVRVGSK